MSRQEVFRREDPEIIREAVKLCRPSFLQLEIPPLRMGLSTILDDMDALF